MRTIWFGVIVVALGACTSAHAQDSMLQKLIFRKPKAKTEPWASEYAPAASTTSQTIVPAAAIEAPVPSVLPATPIVVPAAPPPASKDTGPAPGTAKVLLSVPPTGNSNSSSVIQPALSPLVLEHNDSPRCAKCAAVAEAAKEKCDKTQSVLRRLRNWITFRGLHGCCYDCANCCHHPPLYLYTVHDCVEGHMAHDLPCCAHEMGPFRGFFLGDKETLAASRAHAIAEHSGCPSCKNAQQDNHHSDVPANQAPVLVP
jgi:hypothetical protein